MNTLNGSLEASAQNNQPNSEAVNNEETNTPAKGKGTPANKTIEAVKPKSLEELFGNKADPSSTEIDLDEDETPDDPSKPVDSLDRMMKRYNLTQEQVYDIKVPMKNGAEALTIGQLKDKIEDLVTFETDVTEFEERRVRQEGELLRSQNEIRDLLASLPKDAIKPEVLEKLRNKQELTTRREKQLTLEIIPDWRDEKKRAADVDLMQGILSDYGFDEGFLNSVVDHRAVKLIRDYARMTARIRKSLEQVRDPKKLGVRPSGKSKAAQKPSNSKRQRASSSVTQDDKIRDYFASHSD